MKLSEVMQPTGLKLSQVMGQPERVTDDMGMAERLLAGYGRGVTEIGQGLKQLGLHASGAVGLVDPKTVADYDARVADEARLYEQDLGQTGAGQVGTFLGGAVTTAPLGGISGVAGKQALQQGIQQAAKRGVLDSALRTGAAGAAGAAMMPVTDVEQPATLSDLVTGQQGQGEDFLTAKLKQMALGGGLGSAANLGLRGLGNLVEAAIPSNATARVLNAFGAKANQSPSAKEGEALAAATGVELTPAQISGSKAGTMAENAARQSIFSRDIAFEGDRKRIQQLSDYLDRTLNGVTASDASPAVAGAQVQAAAKNVIGELEKWRSKTAAEDFGKIRAATKGQAAIQPTSTNDMLKAIVAENQGVGTPGADALVNFASKQLANVDPAAKAAAEAMSAGTAGLAREAARLTAPAQGNLDKLMQLRSYLSKVAGGQAKISGENQDRRIAAQLLGTIDNDIEAAGEQIGGDLGGMLKMANARYREVSQQIESVKASPLGKILGEDVAGALQTGQFNTLAPEVVMDRLGRLKPTELGVVRGLLEKDQPQAWNAFKRGLLEDALEKAKAMPASEGANTAVLRPNVLVKNLGDAKRLQAVFNKSELSQIQAGLDVARRLSDKTGFNFSGTAGMNEVMGLMNTAKNATVTGAMSLGGAALGSRQLARIMTDSKGRAALMELQRLPPGASKARELTAYLAALSAGQQSDAPSE